MDVTVALSDKEVKFLTGMIREMNSFSSIRSIEEAIKECIKIAMFDDGEPTADDEGVQPGKTNI
jgi:hypothetical protein